MRLIAKFSLLAALVGASLAIAAPVTAGGYHLEYRFKGMRDGSEPDSNFVKIGGKLYGATIGGGANRQGTIYSFDPATGAETTVYSFAGGSDGSGPSAVLVTLRDKIYGTTGDTVFSFDPATGVEAVVHAFGGQSYNAGPTGLLHIGDTLYGVTFGNGNYGSVFSLDPASGIEHTLHVFKGGSDGAEPVSLTSFGGMLYGMALYGGSPNCGGGCGVVFQVDPASGRETIVHAFQGGTDGALPSYLGTMVETGGLLYGTTQRGGGGGAIDGGSGTIFSVDPTTDAEKVLHAFQGGDDGIDPAGILSVIGDTLYGVTFRGGGSTDTVCGSIGCGTVYSLNLTTGVEEVVHGFRGNQAGFPQSGLTYVDHRLFGTTNYGGRKASGCGLEGCGAMFSVRP